MVSLKNKFVFDYFLKAQPTIMLLMGAVIISCSLLAKKAEAVEMTKEEYQLLPTYCKNQSNTSERYFKPDNEAQWRNRLGKNYMHIHHYCWGLVYLARAYRPSQSDNGRTHLFNLAAGNIYYVIERSTPDFVLLPEMYTKAGQAYLGMKDDRNAEIAFRNAWEANSAYWPAYLWWSQRLMKQGKHSEALAIAEEGLKNSPDSKPLKQLIAEMRGSGKATPK